MGIKLGKHPLGNIFHTLRLRAVTLGAMMWPDDARRGFTRPYRVLTTLKITEKIFQIEDVVLQVLRPILEPLGFCLKNGDERINILR